MRPVLKILLATALAAALVVPAASAKPGNGGQGKGNAGGKPAWAGGGGGKPAWAGGGQANGAAKAQAGKAKGAAKAKGGGKPAWAGQGKAKAAAKKAEQAQRKLERRAAAEDEAEAEEGPLHDNPAFVCKFERSMMGDEAFAEQYGTNPNLANAFGMCVSQEAQARDGVEGDDEEPAEEPTEDLGECEPADDEAPAEELPTEGEEGSTSEETPDSDEPAEGECPADEGDGGEDGDDDGGEDAGADEGSEGEDGSDAEAVLTALRLLL